MHKRPGTVRSLFLALAVAVTGCATVGGDTFPDIDRPTAGIFLESTRAALPQGVQLRPVIDAGLKLTKESEGWVERLYNDAAGYCTIGYGHLVKKARCDGSEPADFRPKITEAAGTELLVSDQAHAQYAVMNHVRIELTDQQYAALVDFAYNVGGEALRKSTLLKLINANKFGGVPDEWNKWVVAGGKPLPGLVARRKREVDLFFNGNPPPSRAAPAEGETRQLIDIRVGG